MVTFSKGGGQFLAGKAADNTDDAACIAGTVAGALHVRQVRGVWLGVELEVWRGGAEFVS